MYEGGFIGDRIVESAAFQVDAMDAEELNAICTGSYFGTGKQFNKTNSNQFTFCCSFFSILGSM